MMFRIKFRRWIGPHARHLQYGRHVQCSVFIAPGPNRTFARCGELMVRAGEEFAVLKKAFNAEFIGDESINAEDDIGTVELAGTSEICEAMKLCLTEKKNS